MRSLNTLLSELLVYAQNRFGPRDPSYQIAIEVADNEKAPRTLFTDPKQIVIRVNQQCTTDQALAIRQIGHEVVHCLGPSPDFTTVLEEGTAQVCAMDAAAACGYLRFSPKPPNRYWRPEWLVRWLLQRNPGGIKQIRAMEPRLSFVGEDLLLQACPRLSDRFVEELTAQFWSRKNA